MERRVLLAAVLSGLVIIIWFSLFAPQRPPTGPVPTPPSAAGTPVTSPGVTPAPAPQPQVASAPAPPAVIGQDGAEVALEGEGWHARVSPKGGVLASLVLSEYRDDVRAPLELVRPGGAPPLSVGVPGPWNDRALSGRAWERVGRSAVERRQGELGREEGERREGEVRARGGGARGGRAGARRGGGGHGAREDPQG